MQKIIRGLREFQDQVFGARRAFFEQLAEGQRPEALFITCSDSRINPNLITQTQPGDLFIIRNAGNIVPSYGSADGGGEVATVEYATEVLGVKDVIVCGHTHCGAMTAVLNPSTIAELPAVRAWLRHADATGKIVRESYRHLEGQALLTAAVQENVLVQIEHLRTHPAIAAGLVRGTVRLHGWVYKLESGEVFAYEPGAAQFVPLREIADGAATPQRAALASI